MGIEIGSLTRGATPIHCESIVFQCVGRSTNKPTDSAKLGLKDAQVLFAHRFRKTADTASLPNPRHGLDRTAIQPVDIRSSL